MELLIKPYDQFHANWVHVIPIITKAFDLKHFFDVFCISESVRQINTHSVVKREYKWIIIAVTKCFILQFEYMAIRPIKSAINHNYDLTFPTKAPKIHKDGSGERITL